MERLSLDQWKSYDKSHMFNQGTSHHEIVAIGLASLFPGFSFRLANWDKISKHKLKGFEMLRAEHIDAELEEFNSEIPVKYMLETTADGLVKFRNQWVMVRPKELSALKQRQMNEKSEELFNRRVTSAAVAGPEGMRTEILEGSHEIRTPTETEVVRTVKKSRSS